MGQFGYARMRRTLIAVTTSALVGSALVWAAQPSAAVHDTGMFELDGTIADEPSATPPWDWGSLFDASGNRLIAPDPVNGPLLASQFNPDSAKPDPTYFTSNKDIQPIGSWGCTTINNPTPKDDLQNAYAALIQIPAGAPDNAGHKVLYLGSERGSNNGDSFAGFWLLKDNSVGCSGSGSFSGHHTDGDILVLSNYTNGGGTQNVTVFRWTGNDASGSPVAVPGLSGAKCGTTTADSACAIANSATITSPWSPTSHASNTFVEAGIDLNNLIDATGGGCFTNFLAESRSSQEITATLKDFASGRFNTCPPPPVTTTATPGGSQVAPGTSQHDVGSVAAVGGRPTPTGTLSFFLCQPAQVTAAGCPSGTGTQVGSAVTLVAGSATSASTTSDTTLGKYCWRAEYAPDAASQNVYTASSDTNATTECFTVVHASPTLATQIAVTGANAPGLGFTTLGDTATLSGFIPGTVTGETVTFKLYGPTTSGTPTCADPSTVVFTTTGTLSAGGVATTSSTFTPTAAGTYVWRAFYPGDSFNDPASDPCNSANESVTVVGAHIDVAKSANPPGPVSAGDTIGFDITVSNAGSVPATGVTVHDALPAGGGDLNWSLVPPYTGCAITGPIGTQVLNCSLGTVTTGTLPVIHVQSSTTAVDCGTVSNQASVATTNGTGGNSDIASVSILCANLSLTKTADTGTVNAGSQIGFTVTAHNAGPGIARNVTINDPLPGGPGINWSIASGPANCSITGTAPTQTLVCTAVDLASGASETVHVVSGTAFASCATYVNTATAGTTNTTPPAPATASVTVQCPSLTLTKTADATPVSAGAQIGFTVTASNGGPGTATGVVINDPLPAGSGVSWSILTGPANCSISGSAPSQTLICTAVDLASGASESVHVVSATTDASCKTYPNTASLTATNAPSLTADASVTVLCPAVTLTKTADATTVDAGSQIGFTITASNTGAGTASGVVINDPLPGGPGVSWSILISPANCSISGSAPSQTLHCTAVDLAPGASEMVHIVSGTEFASCANYPNVATLTATNAEPLEASASITVQCPSLSITKTADDATVSAGSPIGFTISVANAGPGTATAATLSDPLPAGSGVDWSISPAYSGPGSCSITGAVGSQVLNCAFGDLGITSVSVHVTSATAFASCKVYPNVATVSATNAPDQTANASTTVQCPAPVLTKDSDQTLVSAGDQIGFTITLSNGSAPGTGTLTGATINDPLPSGNGVSWSIDSGPANCSITGSAPSQTLVCTAVDLAPGASESVHVVSATTFASCQDYLNVATADATNHDPLTANATTTVLCPNLSLSKTPDAATVDAGSPIGFTITATNADLEGTGTARGVVINDPLPGGPGIDWSISPAGVPSNCSITGTAPTQTLVCTAVTLEPGASESVHVTSPTEFASCAVYPNVASLTATNAPSLQATATTTVQCPALAITKTADAGVVASGSPIGFTVEAKNTGPGTAVAATINDPLPSGTGVSWSIDAAKTTATGCAITGAVGAQVLACALGDLVSGADVKVHVVSNTTVASCKAYDNTATLVSTNAPGGSASATTNVLCALPTSASRTPLAVTGAGPIGPELGWALALIVAGGLIWLLAVPRRRQRRAH